MMVLADYNEAELELLAGFMRERQAQIISTLSVQPEIDPAKEVEARVAFLRDYLVSSGASGFLLAVSGGQDSTLAGRLCQLAVEKLEREGIRAEFVAVRMHLRRNSLASPVLHPQAPQPTARSK